jgi:hypothetical protein
MRLILRILAAVAMLGAASGRVIAHHSFAAQYDANRPVTLKGIVSKVEWTNPHARFYVDVRDESGVVTNWNLELASPNVPDRQAATDQSRGEACLALRTTHTSSLRPTLDEGVLLVAIAFFGILTPAIEHHDIGARVDLLQAG